MISDAREAVAVLEREKNVSDRLEELRRKIHDQDYVDNAIQRIAQVISKRLVEETGELQFRK